MLPKLFRTAHSKVELFCDERGRQTDEQFLAECGIPTSSELARIAIGVKRCIADIDLVDSAFILPTDDFPGSLGVLPLWDSMDFIDLILRIERELDVSLNQGDDSKVFATPFSVVVLIARLARALESRRSSAEM